MAKSKTTKANGKPVVNQENRITEFVQNEVQQRTQILNELLSRSGFLADYLSQKRDVDAECGYPGTNQLTIELLRFFYDREPVATRVVQVLPEECWHTVPVVFETEDADEVTEFEEAWDNLSLSLSGESKFRRKEGSPIWEYMKRADVLSGIGFFGVIYLSLDDGLDPLEPAEFKQGQKLLFMRAFDQSQVDITAYETNVANPRFGMPTKYSIEFSSPVEASGGIGSTSVTKNVHWSRIIHIADNLGSNEVYGVPRMRPVFNRLWDLRKLYSGSAEMYWKGAFPGISIETHPSLGGNVSIDIASLRENIDNYQQGLQRYLTLSGMAAKSLAPQVVDPSAQVETQIDAICIQLGIPKRIFMGSERGELSSSQDKSTWLERLETRQNGYLTPRLIAPFIDRLVTLGVLPEPEEYHIEWPDLDAQTEDEKATIAVKQVEALVKYVAGDVEMIMSPIDLYTKVLHMDIDEASAILEAALESFEDSEAISTKILEAKTPPPQPEEDEGINPIELK